jgi:hypothetical protein
MASRFVGVVCILPVRRKFLEHALEPPLRVVVALIERQRRLVDSTDPARRFQTLWIASLLDNRLRQCTDRGIGELLAIAQIRFNIFEPEFALCYHAKRRLLLKP